MAVLSRLSSAFELLLPPRLRPHVVSVVRWVVWLVQVEVVG